MNVGNINTETRCMRIQGWQNSSRSVIIRPDEVDGKPQSRNW